MNSADLLPPEIMEEDFLLDSAAQLEEAARALDLEDWIVQHLKHPERELSVNLPLLRDIGDTTLCAGYRVQHFRGRAGCLGPVLLAPNAHVAQLRPLALHITLQCALFNLPLGGSAGAIVCDPAQLTETELRHLVRDYLTGLDLRADIFAPTEFAAAWTSTKTSRHLEPAAIVVGKPAILGGLPDSAAAIAAGWFTLISEALAARVPRPGPGLARAGTSTLPSQPHRSALDGCCISLQGFGPAAAALARLLHGAGARIVALADKSGGLFAERGLDLPAVSAHVAKHGLIYGFDAAEPVRNSDVLEAACDLLITAAAERQLNPQNASRIRAPLILEAVHNAVTPAARRILESHGLTVIPSLLGAAPATLAWFAEWQHAIHYSVPEQEPIESNIRRQISAIFHRVQAVTLARNCNLADTALLLALEKHSANLRLTR